MLDKVFKALADPTRRRILKILNRGDMTAGDIARQFDLAAPTMSHHFSVLKDADLVFTQRSGTTVVYSLNTTVVQDIVALLLDVFGENEK